MTPRTIAKRALERFGYRVERLRAFDDEPLYMAFPTNSTKQRRFINVGAGSFRHRYWTNVDFASEWYERGQTPGFVDYNLTAMEPLPFDDDSIELAYSSHTIEHVPDDAVSNLLRECHRVLRAGGGLRITCPDAALMYRTVIDGNLAYWHWRRSWFRGSRSTASDIDNVTVYDYFVREIATRRCRFYTEQRDAPDLAQLEKLFASRDYRHILRELTAGLAFDAARPGEHINYWDERKLIEMLRDAGFDEAYPSRRGQSRFAPMMAPSYFDTTMPMGSLYVEARKS